MRLIPQNAHKENLFPEKKKNIKNNNWTGNLTRFTLNYSNIAYKAETFFPSPVHSNNLVFF